MSYDPTDRSGMGPDARELRDDLWRKHADFTELLVAQLGETARDGLTNGDITVELLGETLTFPDVIGADILRPRRLASRGLMVVMSMELFEGSLRRPLPVPTLIAEQSPEWTHAAFMAAGTEGSPILGSMQDLITAQAEAGRLGPQDDYTLADVESYYEVLRGRRLEPYALSEEECGAIRWTLPLVELDEAATIQAYRQG